MKMCNNDKIALLKEYDVSKENGVVIEKYLDMLFTYNKKMNLTGLDDRRRSWHELIGPALGFYRHTREAGDIVDIGSGNGIPGIIIAIMNKEKKVTLIESRKNKAAFLREVKYQLGLSCEIIDDRAENITNRLYECVVGFRVAELEVFLSISSPILSSNGFVVQYCPQLPGGKDGDEMKVVDKSKNVWYYRKCKDGFIIVKKCFT